MSIEAIKNCLLNGSWGTEDFRSDKEYLVRELLGAVESFSPLESSEYKDNPIQLIDFFCGAGGTSLGFASVNKILPTFKMLGGCDINEISAKSYSKNFGTPVINRDITELAYEDGELEKVLNQIGYDPSKPTVLIGCAPCQGFTSHRKRYWDEEDDGRNTLILAFAEIVKKMNPDAIIMENVPEFLSKKYWQYFSTAKKKYEECGYVVKESIYNAASFGVPQERFRAIVIAMKHDFLLPSIVYGTDEYRTVRDAISNFMPLESGESDPDDPMHVAAKHKESTLDVIRHVPHDGGSRPAGIGSPCLDRTKGFADVYGRLYWDRPSITITASSRNPASGRFSHPEQDRVITTREAAALQSFPKGFVFTGGQSDISRQIGEAVPPLLAAGVAASVIIELISTLPSENELSESIASITEPVSSSYSSVIAGLKNSRKGKKQQ